jgi:hypothetical protein
MRGRDSHPIVWHLKTYGADSIQHRRGGARLILTQHDLAVRVKVLVRRKIHRALKHPLSPFKRRTLYSVVILALVLALGTEGMHLLEGWSYVDSFYFVSLIATTQGPASIPRTDSGKIFASLIAFVSVGAALSAVAFIFGPLFGTLLKVGISYVEREEEKLREKQV